MWLEYILTVSGETLDFKSIICVSLRNYKQLDDEVEIFITNIQQSAWKKHQKLRELKGTIILKEIKELIAEKKGNKIMSKQSRDPQDSAESSQLTREIKELKEMKQ